MADVKWIKITTDMFDNRKIRYLRKFPEGNNIVLIWIMLLTMAGRCNANGMIFLTENVPYSTKMLADELDFEETTVQMALQALESLNMITTDFLSITGWEEHQNIDGMEKIREQNRIRKAKQREKQKLLQQSCDSHATVTQSHAIDIDKEEDKDKNKKKNKIKDSFSVYKSSDPDLYQALKDYEAMRKQMKKPMTERSKTMLLTKLGEYPDEDWIPMINEAINRNWMSVYPLKDSGSAFKQNFRKPGKAEELNDAYSMMSSWAEEGGA